MNRSIALIASAALAAGLTGCSFQSSNDTPDISRPGTSVTQAPHAPVHPDPPCRSKTVCPR